MATIRQRIANFINPVKEKKEAPQVVLNTTTSYYYRNDNYQSYAEEGYKQNAIVYRCVNEIAHGAASIGWRAFQGDIELEEHPILTLLNRPNPMQAGVEFFQSLYSYLLLSGNSYAIKSDVGGLPRELYLLRPDRIKIEPSKTSTPKAYAYIVDGKILKYYEADPLTGESDLKHIKMWNPLDDFYGCSPLSAAAVDIDNHNAINKHNISLLNNGARPSGAIIFKPQDDRGVPLQLTDGQRQQLNEDLRSRFSGPQNAGRPVLLEGDFDWREMGLSPKDMDFLQQKNIAAKDIALCFGVPSQLIGIPDAQTYANVQEARLALYEETIIPIAKRVESDMNEWLTKSYGEDITLKYDFDGIPAMTERRRRTYENVVQAVREGIISRNEARERIGLEPITGGDDVFISANLFPLGSTEVAPAEGSDAEEDGKGVYGFEEFFEESKEEIAKDVFSTEEEAQVRADQIGCIGTHSHETEDGIVYMPCESHEDYERLTGDTLETPKYHTADPEFQVTPVRKDPRYGTGRDVFDRQPQAAERARELGCSGTHTVRGPDGNFYMPCSSHAIYLRITGQNKAESDIETTPTNEMAEEAQRGLDWRREFGRGGTAVGVARARQLVNKDRLSPSTVRRMKSFFARHEVDKEAEGFRRGEEGYPSAGRIAWALWGGDAGKTWSEGKVKQLDAERDKTKSIDSTKAKVSEKIRKAIEGKVKEHNDKHGDKKGKRVTQRMLEAVFRRGVGAYRTNPESVRPTVMGPDQWGLARVNAFLFAVRSGRFRSGKFDLDLLPRDHPLSSKD